MAQKKSGPRRRGTRHPYYLVARPVYNILMSNTNDDEVTMVPGVLRTVASRDQDEAVEADLEKPDPDDAEAAIASLLGAAPPHEGDEVA